MALIGSLLAAAALSAPSPALATNPGSHNDFSWTDNTPASSIQQTIKLSVVPGSGKPASTYWALGGGFQNGIDGDGWYMGIQTDGSNFSGQDVGDEAIFSVWNATVAGVPGPTSTCGTFGGEGIGISCHVPVTTTPGDTYSYTVREVEAHVWEAAVTDITTGKSAEIGEITSPARDGLLTGAYNFIENFGADACAQQGETAAQYADPVVNGATRLTYAADSDSVAACTATIETGPGGVGASLNTTFNPGPPALPAAPPPPPSTTTTTTTTTGTTPAPTATTLAQVRAQLLDGRRLVVTVTRRHGRRTGDVPVLLGCPKGSGGCDGWVRITMRVRTKVKGHGEHVKARRGRIVTVRLGRRRYRLAAGARKRLAVAISRRAWTYMPGGSGSHQRVTVSASGPGGRWISRSVTLRLRAAKRQAAWRERASSLASRAIASSSPIARASWAAASETAPNAPATSVALDPPIARFISATALSNSNHRSSGPRRPVPGRNS